MPVNVYECMFLLDKTRVEGDVPGAAKQLHAILEKNQAEILASRPWDDRKLAYPVKGQNKGLYYLTYFRVDGKRLVEIEKDCALSELILRMLPLHVDPKMVDAMLAVARDEHALALQTATSENGETAPLTEGTDEGGPRRGRRLPEGPGKE